MYKSSNSQPSYSPRFERKSTKLRAVSIKLTSILGKSSQKNLGLAQSGILGEERSPQTVKNIVIGLRDLGVDQDLIRRGLSLLNLKTQDQAAKALIKGENGYEHQFIPEEDGSQKICEICKQGIDEHYRGGDWDAFEHTTGRISSKFRSNQQPWNKIQDSFHQQVSADLSDQQFKFQSKSRQKSNDFNKNLSPLSSVRIQMQKEKSQGKNNHQVFNQEEYNLKLEKMISGQISSEYKTSISYKRPSLSNKAKSQKKEEQLNLQDAASIIPNQEAQQLCLVCYINYPSDQFVGLSCGHSFCINCTLGHLEAKIASRDILNIDCLQKCGAHFNPADIELICSNHKRMDIFQKYEYFRLSNDVERDPLLTWCPKANCGGFAKRTSKDVEEEHLKCLKCQYMFCGNCKAAAHNKGQCVVQHVEEFKQFVDAQKVRVCPKCQLKVQKNLGCNHMTCAVCKHEWCWKCGTPYYGYQGHDGQFCREYIDADNFKIQSKKFCCTITVLVLISPFLLIPFLILTPFHILGWYFKKIDDRDSCKCLHKCPGCFMFFILIISIIGFICLFPILMLAAIPAMIIILCNKIKKYKVITKRAREYWMQFKKVAV